MSFPFPSQQAPDYRLYKSEPELTTVKEEVDEANGEDKDKTESSPESKDTAALKGTFNYSSIQLLHPSGSYLPVGFIYSFLSQYVQCRH